MWQSFVNISPGMSKNWWTKKDETLVKFYHFTIFLSLELYVGNCSNLSAPRPELKILASRFRPKYYNNNSNNNTIFI